MDTKTQTQNVSKSAATTIANKNDKALDAIAEAIKNDKQAFGLVDGLLLEAVANVNKALVIMSSKGNSLSQDTAARFVLLNGKLEKSRIITAGKLELVEKQKAKNEAAAARAIAAIAKKKEKAEKAAIDLVKLQEKIAKLTGDVEVQKANMPKVS